MIRIIKTPRIIPAAGTPPKTIEEYIGKVVSGTSEVSIARMISPPGWSEPFQKPEFDEYTLVLKGTLILETDEKTYHVSSGQGVIVPKGSTIRYQTPEGAEYVAICIPAFSSETVHRNSEKTDPNMEITIASQYSYHIETSGPEEIDRVEPLWRLLREYIISENHPFENRMKKVRFSERKQEIIRKNSERQIRLFFAVDDRTKSDIGYCLCSAAPQVYGEIESIFIHENARNKGIGTNLVEQAISWMKNQKISEIQVHVTVGNEVVMPFYKKFGLFPRQYILENPEEL